MGTECSSEWSTPPIWGSIFGRAKLPARQTAAPSDVQWQPGAQAPTSGWGFKQNASGMILSV